MLGIFFSSFSFRFHQQQFNSQPFIEFVRVLCVDTVVDYHICSSVTIMMIMEFGLLQIRYVYFATALCVVR